MYLSLEYRVKVDCHRLLESLYASLKPELTNLPRDCRGGLNTFDDYLEIKLECSNVSKLLALNNSFIGVLLMLLELVGERCNERENSTPGGPATCNPVSNT
ncbi:MAG: KEOPS complex Pcc1-like subunit [Desulfurococcaceae archaeon]